ncbi:helix-turn-helix domain-containing protein [Agromyces sp. NPDC049794]|uniref:IclR family transcriptional regulator n=1 Tax=unclassified Agromyces TaxID=2639701 RepID=UPI00340B2F94
MQSPDLLPAEGDETSESTTSSDRGPIQSIDRAANVLALFDENTRTLTPTFVAEQLGLNRTTARRYLQALQGAGFLSAGFGPGPLIDQLSALVSIRQQLITLAPPVLRALSDRTGLTAVMSFLGRTGAVVTLVEEATEGTILLTVRVGTVLELRAAQSRVLFAFQSDPEVVMRALAELTTAEAHLEQQELSKVRRDGLAWADLRRTGLESVAAPVFGHRSGVHAAIALLGTTALLTSSPEADQRVQMLRDAAAELGTILGG